MVNPRTASVTPIAMALLLHTALLAEQPALATDTTGVGATAVALPPPREPVTKSVAQSWTLRPLAPRAQSETSLNDRLRLPVASRDGGTARVLIGGVIGATTGFAVCTGISSMVNEGTGISTCPTDTSLLFVAGGFLAGAAVAWLTR